MKTTDKPKTKAKRHAALAAALLLIILLFAAYDAVNGDPISEKWAVHRAIQYAEKLYPGQTFHRDTATGTGGQFFNYMVYVQSDQSEDTRFMVQTKLWLFTTDTIKGLRTVPEHTFYVEQRWNTAIRMGAEAAGQASAYLAVQAPQLQFVSAYGKSSDTVEIDLAYSDEKGSTPGDYAESLPLDAPFDKTILQKVPSRLCAQILCEEKPTQQDMQTVLHTIKQVMEENDMPITYYDIALVPSLEYADHEAFLGDVLESGPIPAEDIA